MRMRELFFLFTPVLHGRALKKEKDEVTPGSSHVSKNFSENFVRGFEIQKLW